MTDLSLTTFYAGWDRYQHLLVDAITPLTLEQLALRGSPHHWPIGRIAAHIIAARVWWFHSRAGEGNTDLALMEHWDNKGESLRSAAELAHGLAITWHMIHNALDRWTLDDLKYIFPVRQDDRTARSRQWIIYHVLEHDIHHGGEISCILGAHGLPAVALE